MAENIHNIKASGMQNIRPKIMMGVVVWIMLQLPRFVAVPIMQDVLNGIDSPAWLFPAILDIIVAITAPFVAFLIWRKRGLGIWMLGILFFVVSIVDHLDAATAGLIAPAPRIFAGSNSGSNIIIPVLQMTLDIIALIILTRPRITSYYLASDNSVDSLSKK